MSVCLAQTYVPLLLKSGLVQKNGNNLYMLSIDQPFHESFYPCNYLDLCGAFRYITRSSFYALFCYVAPIGCAFYAAQKESI